MRSVHKVFIANRGEIAARIARTCRRMGIATAYAKAPFLDISAMVAQARAAGADAVHPGYGFLAENADFADACIDAGLIFVGPQGSAIRALGSKESGRAIALEAGVPIVPCDGYPLLIKASAGGGGRGMRIVQREEDRAEAEAAARSEALRAFGDDSLVFERYIAGARHVEVQIMGDRHGRVIAFAERDCSVQRRHQKIVEESPSPAVDAALRELLCDAAVRIARAVGYENAGTVEFLLAPNGEYFFIEVNTRIQVEHPVTEAITGLDLIELQLRVAAGESLAHLPERPPVDGHAIEVRLCAEDPWNNFLPSTGELRVFHWPRELVRVETAIEQDTEITPQYDSMIAKFIAHGPTRDYAIRKMALALRETELAGVATNRNYLLQVLESAEFRSGNATTEFLPAPVAPAGLEEAAASVAAFIAATEFPKHGLAGYRNNPFRPLTLRLTSAGQTIDADWTGELSHEVRKFGQQYIAGLHTFERADRHPRPAHAGERDSANSPMPGLVLRILAEAGQTVRVGQPLLVVEAMKMEQTIKSQMDGVVKTILVKPGDVVAPGQTLVQLTAGAAV